MLPTTLLAAILTFGASVLAAPASEAAPAPDANHAPASETVPALAARSGEYLGGLDLNNACQVQYHADTAYAEKRGDGCNAWSCANDNPNNFFYYLSIKMGDACVRAYGNPTYAWCEKGAYDWGCYRA
jgi:hypothetical protein